MSNIIDRWRHAAERALEEGIKVIRLGDEYRATSASTPLASYRLYPTPEGWACECMANSEYGVPCKHLWALADALDLDVLADMRVDWAAMAEAEQPEREAVTGR
jgi:hypothetical protein